MGDQELVATIGLVVSVLALVASISLTAAGWSRLRQRVFQEQFRRKQEETYRQALLMCLKLVSAAPGRPGVPSSPSTFSHDDLNRLGISISVYLPDDDTLGALLGEVADMNVAMHEGGEGHDGGDDAPSGIELYRLTERVRKHALARLRYPDRQEPTAGETPP